MSDPIFSSFLISFSDSVSHWFMLSHLSRQESNLWYSPSISWASCSSLTKDKVALRNSFLVPKSKYLFPVLIVRDYLWRQFWELSATQLINSMSLIIWVFFASPLWLVSFAVAIWVRRRVTWRPSLFGRRCIDRQRTEKLFPPTPPPPPSPFPWGFSTPYHNERLGNSRI